MDPVLNARKDAPKSFRDPFYAQLAANTERKLKLPEGLLAKVVTDGERSNADQVSEAGARTVFQIIPSTRKAALDKFGIDAYLSPENAAEVAGLLLKESLQRNRGDMAAAVGEYHGGTDRSNWGPRTRAYVQRVTGALQPGSEATADGDVPAGGQLSERAIIARAYEAYRAGRMPADAAAEFEEDVNSGAIQLPLGASLKRRPPAAYKVPDSVIEAYVSGAMDPEAMAQFEEDVRADPSLLPDGLTLGAPPQAPQAPGFMDRLSAVPGQVRELFTGAQRSTPEVEALPDWVTMPELSGMGARAEGASAFAPLKVAVGSQLAGADEAAKIVQANFPGVEVRQDEKGNYIFRSGMNGQEYAMKPGFRLSDIGRTLAGVAAFTPAGAARTIPSMVGASGLTQATIEGAQAATGGEFSAGDVGMAAAAGGAVPIFGSMLRTGVDRVRQVLARGRGAPGVPPTAGAPQAAATPSAQPSGRSPAAQPESPVPGAGASPPSSGAAATAGQIAEPAAATAPAGPLPSGAAAPVTAAPGGAAAATANLTPEQLGQATRKAAQGGLGSKGAMRTVAQESAPDPEVIESAKRLGIEDFLQPDHVTTNQAFRELSQVLKSVPGSASGAAEREGLERVAQRADDLITDMGGMHDLSTLDAGVKRQLEAARAQLKAEADKLYDEVRNAVPARSEVPATNVLALLEQRAGDLGGQQYLSAMEKQILLKLSPKPVKGAAGKVIGQRKPTYALLDDVRRDLTAAQFKRAGAFKDADDRLVDMLQGALREDQQAAAAKFGAGETWDLAQKTARTYKGMQDDMKSLFGDKLAGTIVGDLSKSVAALSKGDVSRFVKLIKAIPEGMRQEVVASSLATAFGKNAKRGAISFTSYARWFEGLQKNQQAYTALMVNLPPSARQGLRDLYVVSNGISKATRERVTTGRLSEGMKAIERQLESADSLMAKVYETAAKSAGGVAAEAVSSTAGVPGAGIAAAVASTFRGGRKPSAFEAADKLFASPDFIRMTRAATAQERAAATRRFAHSKEFTRFMRTVGSPRELSNPERWVLQAMQAEHQQTSVAR